MSESLILPRAREFAQRQQDLPLGRFAEGLLASASLVLGGRRRRLALAFARRVEAASAELRTCSSDDLAASLTAAVRLVRAGSRLSAPRDALVHCFAGVRETVRRVTGIEAYPVQLAAAYGLYTGAAVEMATGEGKTLSAMIAAAVHGLLGRAVHVISANDYLAERDGAALEPAYSALGLTVGVIGPDMGRKARRAAYRADVVYAANKEIAFDYLRDRLGAGSGSTAAGADIMVKVARALGDEDAEQPVLRALDVGIVDEADSVLIDDAGTPLLISKEAGAQSVRSAAEALEIAGQLSEDIDWRVDRIANVIALTEHGLTRTRDLSAGFGGQWRQRVRREEMISQALSALHLFRRDEHYVVRDSKIIIVDQNTGRTMGDRFWGQGLHQMIELKEGLEGTGDKRPLISTTYQRFFRRYQVLSGTSGTIDECAREMAAVYRLPPLRIPQRLKSRRVERGPLVFPDASALLAAMTDEVADRVAKRQPVLVGVRSVQEAEAASVALTARGIDHAVLSAAQDADENSLVARAGEAGRVTVATNMAGRGTDIRLGPGVAEAGGLAVILCQCHFSARVDRQLSGRAARQGDPGETVSLVSADDGLLAAIPGRWGSAARHLVHLPNLARPILRMAQRLHEHEGARRRRRLIQTDRRISELLAFSGGLE